MLQTWCKTYPWLPKMRGHQCWSNSSHHMDGQSSSTWSSSSTKCSNYFLMELRRMEGWEDWALEGDGDGRRLFCCILISLLAQAAWHNPPCVCTHSKVCRDLSRLGYCGWVTREHLLPYLKEVGRVRPEATESSGSCACWYLNNADKDYFHWWDIVLSSQ